MREGATSKYMTRFFMYAFLIVVSFISVFPLYWAIISALNNTQQILGGRMIPSVYLIENLKNLFAQQDVFNAMKNSFATSILQTVLSPHRRPPSTNPAPPAHLHLIPFLPGNEPPLRFYSL